VPTIRIDLPMADIEAFCRKWKIRELALFGSVLREDFRPDSDVDVLVTFDDAAEWSLWDFIDAQQELESLFGRKVDFVEKKCVTNPFRRHSILSTKQTIYTSPAA
jgi:predicted nucleotidyltransferase